MNGCRFSRIVLSRPVLSVVLPRPLPRIESVDVSIGSHPNGAVPRDGRFAGVHHLHEANPGPDRDWNRNWLVDSATIYLGLFNAAERQKHEETFAANHNYIKMRTIDQTAAVHELYLGTNGYV